MTARSAGRLTLVVAAFLLVLAWSTSIARLPLYDGIQLPAQPYRYLNPPRGVHNPGPPTSTSQSFGVSTGKWLYQAINTSERPPQCGVILDDNAVIVPAGARRITVSVHAVNPPSLPQDGPVEGNVYSITATADNGGPVRLRKGKTTINMRAIRIHGTPVIEEYTGGQWIHLQTGQYIGIALYGGAANSLGDFALVVPGPIPHAVSGSSYLPFIVIAAIILVVAGLAPLVLLAVRRRRRTT